MPKYRKMLADWNAPYIQALLKQIETQSKSTLAGWALDYSVMSLLPIWQKTYPTDPRPMEAVNAAREWLAGRVKLPEAKPAILAAHQAAQEAEGNPAAQAAARGISHSASIIHSASHCMGLPLYGALAVAYDVLGPDAAWTALEGAAGQECWRMLAALQAVSVTDEPNPAKFNWKC